MALCVVVVGRNLGEMYGRMLGSIERQNYTNYRVVYVDDSSDDATPQNIQTLLHSTPTLTQKTTFLTQPTQKYALYNRNTAIRNHCNNGDIIIDLDADDWLIGNQVFNIVNAIYQDEKIWACYFNNIIYSDFCGCPLLNADAVVS